MLRKIYKKSILALIVTVVMAMTLTLSASASGDGGFGTASGNCSHGRPGIGAYSWNPDNFQAKAVMESHTGCNAVSVSAVLMITRNGVLEATVLTANGTITDGLWEATINYTPPSNTKINFLVGVTFKCCDINLK